MECLVCGNGLTQMTAGGVTVDVCKGGCGRLWFDRYELMKVDETGKWRGRRYCTSSETLITR